MNKELKDGLIRYDGTAKMSKKDGQETGIYMLVILAAKIKVKINSERIKKSWPDSSNFSCNMHVHGQLGLRFLCHVPDVTPPVSSWSSSVTCPINQNKHHCFLEAVLISACNCVRSASAGSVCMEYVFFFYSFSLVTFLVLSLCEIPS